MVANKDQPVAIIVSRNFNPGHYSHLVANYKLFSENDIDVYMYHHPRFNKMSVIEHSRIINRLADLKALEKVDLAVFWFPSVKNIIDILLLKILYRTRVVYVFHEPFESLKSYYDAGFSTLKTFRIVLISLINYILVLLSSKIILTSSKAYETFEAKYSHTHKPFRLTPLMFDDEVVQLNTRLQRSFISYIGTIAEDHAFNEFVKFAVCAIVKKWYPGYKFLIATRSTLPPYERSLLLSHIESGAVVINESNPMSNEEINNFYNSSVVVWNSYKRSMQSGVLPKAYMFGTPLIVSLNNVSEYFYNHQTGVLVGNDYLAGDLKNAVDEILKNFDEYSGYCRNKFLQVFYYKKHATEFVRFVFE